MPRTITLAAALVAAIALAACSPQEPAVTLEEQVPADQRDDSEAADGEAADAEAVTWEAFDLGFDGPTELPAGQVTLRLDNTGNLPHDITIAELGDRMVVEADGGETAETTIDLDPGTYTFYCSVPGHRDSMEETVEVTG